MGNVCTAVSLASRNTCHVVGAREIIFLSYVSVRAFITFLLDCIGAEV